MAPKPRVYRKGLPGSEYDAYHGKPEQIKRRSERNTARRKALRLGKVRVGDGKEVHHTGSHRTGSLAHVSVRVVPWRKNRKWQPKRS